MKNTRQSQSSKDQGAKQQHAVRQNLEKFGEFDTPEKIAGRDREDDSKDSSSTDDKIKESFSEFGSSVDKFAGGLAQSAIGQAKETVAHARDTMTQFNEAITRAKETVSQAKATVDAVKQTARQVIQHMKNNPEPFIAAAIPGLIGLYLLVEKVRKPSASIQ